MSQPQVGNLTVWNDLASTGHFVISLRDWMLSQTAEQNIPGKFQEQQHLSALCSYLASCTVRFWQILDLHCHPCIAFKLENSNFDALYHVGKGESCKQHIVDDTAWDSRGLCAGLDSFAALSVMDHMSQLALLGHTIIASIHQPRADIFNRFNKVSILPRQFRIRFWIFPPYHIESFSLQRYERIYKGLPAS